MNGMLPLLTLILFASGLILPICNCIEYISIENTTENGIKEDESLNDDEHQNNPAFIIDPEYNKYSLPNKTVLVNVSMHIIDINLVSEESMNFQIDFYLRQIWMDKRLSSSMNQQNSNYPYLLGSKFLETIWHPDTFISTAKSINQHSYGTFSDGNCMVRIHDDGEVFYSHRLTATIHCANELIYFPSDKPRCHLIFESYKHSSKEIMYNWIKEITFNKQLSMNNFELVNITGHKHLITLTMGNYTQLDVDICLARNCAFYLVQIYLPAIILVVMSWLSFFFADHQHNQEDNQITVRQMIAIFTSIAIVLLIMHSTIALPQHYTVRAIDVYLFFCLLMILSTFAVVSCLQLKNSEYAVSYNVEQCHTASNYSHTYRTIKIILPVIFILFNISYGLIVGFIPEY